MLNLLLRTWSQAIQACLPAVVALVWLRRHDDQSGAKAVRLGMMGAVLLTPLAGFWFEQVEQQSQLEAGLAWTAAAIGFVALLRSASGETPRLAWPWRAALVLTAVLLILRQAMEIGVVAWVAAFELRSGEALLALAAGVLLGIGVALTYGVAGRTARPLALAAATRAFGVLYVAQALVYAVHESAESGWLPFSDVLHAATEPYGPDGVYGPLGSGMVALIPLLVGLVMSGRDRRHGPARQVSAALEQQRVVERRVAGHIHTLPR